MKGFTAILMLALAMCLSFSLNTFAAEDNAIKEDWYSKFEFDGIVTEVIEDKIEILSEEVVDIKTKESETRASVRWIPIEKTFKKIGSRSNKIKLYGIKYSSNKKIAVGTHKITINYTWDETWLCDENGAKKRLISSSKKEIINAWREYDSLPGFDVWETHFDKGIGGTVAEAYGDVKSKAGTHSFYNKCACPR
ncbi:hypothetical protein [Paramaledivibacter caminithermalis]|uniref:Uncharacterized protein n=1 Tax=Paramaledivibacter caminithermalis (strain DSM 15212 / CIP 107654 / DViRD3) TaxID=1121301 RepID=A0A1M6RDW5_PARC5|nr:hypothetical protein [Paramaledivibacter caminithermalis]SHK30681.1 hypothetical protein SAMN02745912_02930 [Paramaledivibacter caminithermalis DSM 15212]